MSMPVDADAPTQYAQRLGAQAHELEHLEQVHLRIGNIQIGLATLAVVGAVLALGWKAFSILWVLVPATVMIVISEFVGLHIAAALYLAFYMRAVGKIGWVTTILVSLLVPMSLYIAFDKLFLVPLPQGIWGAKLIPF